MKVFEVITQHCEGDSNQMITTRQYVTTDDDRLITVVEHFTRHCYEHHTKLISVSEVLTFTII